MPHPSADVFALWRDPESVRAWMCPAPDVSITELDWPFEVGRAYRLVMDVGGADVAFSGEFLEIVPGERVVLTWRSTRTDERPTRVTVEFTEARASTLVRLTHELLPTEESAEDHREGWEAILLRLAEVVGAA